MRSPRHAGTFVVCYANLMHKRSVSRLSKKTRYLQIALNSSLEEAASILSALPPSDRIIIEAGTPLIKRYGMDAIRSLSGWWSGKIDGAPYVVADMKTMDRGETEVEMAARAGASGVIALGSAPIETLNAFVAACETFGVDPMIDMMNVEFPVGILRALKKPPRVVILHRGVDEERDNRQKMLPLHEIRRIKGAYDILVAIAGGDTPREVQSAAFNDADIVVVWKSVYERTSDTQGLVDNFLKTIK